MSANGDGVSTTSRITKSWQSILLESKWHLGFAAVMALSGWLMLFLRLGYCAGVVVGLTDLYLITVLWSAASWSSRGIETWPRLPGKGAAVLIFACTLLALVFGFGALYFETVMNAECTSSAAYCSFVNLATFSYDPKTFITPSGKTTATIQLASGLLLLICALPLLVSRLADFGGGVRSLTFNGCRVFLPHSPDAEVTIKGASFEWKNGENTVTAVLEAGAVNVTCVKTVQVNNAKLVVIESEGKCHVQSS